MHEILRLHNIVIIENYIHVELSGSLNLKGEAEIVMITKTIATLLILGMMTAGIVLAAPLSIEGGKDAVHKQNMSTTVALFSDKPAKKIAGAVGEESFGSGVPLSPALILFGAALGAIGWLGHSRKKGQPTEDQ